MANIVKQLTSGKNEIKKAFIDALAAQAALSSSGKAAAEWVFDRTIGVFVDNFEAEAVQRLNDPVLNRYVFRAVTEIAAEAASLAENGEVEGWHVRTAANTVIKKFRTICPPQIAKGTFEQAKPGRKWKRDWAAVPKNAHGDLCRDFEVI